jgi:hypothetical protein
MKTVSIITRARFQANLHLVKARGTLTDGLADRVRGLTESIGNGSAPALCGQLLLGDVSGSVPNNKSCAHACVLL